MEVLTSACLEAYIASIWQDRQGRNLSRERLTILRITRWTGKYYVRMKSRLTGKGFRRDIAFEGSRKSAALLGRGSKMASAHYRRLPAKRKSREVFTEMTGRVMLWFKKGRTEEEVQMLLNEEYPLVEVRTKLVKVRFANTVFIIPRYELLSKRKAYAVRE